MRSRDRALLAVVVVSLAGAVLLLRLSEARQAIQVADNELAGAVMGPDGPEAGVWVIAETSDLPTKYVKIVVTDDRGRYLIPELPKANYSVWVRGYGLVDSRKVRTTPGRTVNLTAIKAPNARAAAEYYPAGYWYSLMIIPDKSEFPLTGMAGNRQVTVASQAHLLRSLKSGACTACHQIGNKAMREIPASLGEFPNSVAAWDRRIQSGQAGGAMSNTLNQLGRDRMLATSRRGTTRMRESRDSRRAAVTSIETA